MKGKKYLEELLSNKFVIEEYKNEINEYVDNLEQQVKKQKEVINDVIEYVENRIVEDDYMLKVDTDMVQKELLDILKDKEV